jgi:hypothetical protein
VVTDPDALLPALERAVAEHPRYVAAQRRFAAESLGDVTGVAPARAAEAVLAVLRR